MCPEKWGKPRQVVGTPTGGGSVNEGGVPDSKNQGIVRPKPSVKASCRSPKLKMGGAPGVGVGLGGIFVGRTFRRNDARVVPLPTLD